MEEKRFKNNAMIGLLLILIFFGVPLTWSAAEFMQDANKTVVQDNIPLNADTTENEPVTPQSNPAPVPAPQPDPRPYVPPSSYSSPAESCDENYDPCVDEVSYDLDCADIGFEVEVVGYDVHGLDRDGDGFGCETY